MNGSLQLLLASPWTWEPSVLLGLAAVTIAYALAVGPLRSGFPGSGHVPAGRQAAFHLGTLSLFLALTSPIDRAAETYLLSVHMFQHILILFVTCPLWILGLPGWLVGGLDRRLPAATRLGRWITQPLAAFGVFNITLIFWHLPAAYDAALLSVGVHIVMHVTFLAAGMIGWWPVLAPDQDRVPQASLPARLVYLILMVFPGLGLAVLLTLSPKVLYPFYQPAVQIGIDPLVDQQVAGIMMWLTGTFAYLIPLTFAYYEWIHAMERADRLSLNLAGSAERSA